MILLIITLVIAIYFPLDQYFNFPAVRARLETDPDYKRHFFLETARSLWLIALILAGVLWYLAIPFSELGFVLPLTTRFFGVLIVILLLTAVSFYRLNITAANYPALSKAHAHVRFVLPENRSQLQAMTVTAVSAGITEEFIFRAYMFWYFDQYLHWLPAVLLLNGVFCLGHLWSGRKNAVGAFVLGLAFSAIYLLSGSIFTAMLAHTLVDIYMGLVGLRLVQYEQAQPAESLA